MKEIVIEYKELKNRKYLNALFLLSAILSFGYGIIHPTIGMDDTGIETYFTQGLAPKVGRWTLFLLNKILHVSEFTPFFVDAIGLILLYFAVLAFIVYFKKLSNNSIHTIGYAAFGCLFLTSPFMGEVFIYYLHNGIGLSFLLVALSAICMLKVTKEGKMNNLLWASIMLSLSIGCYESFALVYILTVCLTFFYEAMQQEGDKDKLGKRFKKFLLKCFYYVVPLVLSMVTRTIVSKLITKALKIDLSARSITQINGWKDSSFLETIKRLVTNFALRYVVNGVSLVAVRVFALSMIAFFAVIILLSIIRKNAWIFVWGFAMMLSVWLLIPVELTITPYRASQAVVLLVAVSAMIISDSILSFAKESKKALKAAEYCLIVLLFVVTFNQGFALNRYFYFDDLKYKNDVFVARSIGENLMSRFDCDKPVAFVGEYVMPKYLRDYVYLSFDSPKYHFIADNLKYSLRDGFYEYVDNDYGYRLYEIGSQDPLAWMSWAKLDEKQLEIYKFMEMNGFSFVPASEEMIDSAKVLAQDMPSWPKDGYIIETDEMIIVKIQ